MPTLYNFLVKKAIGRRKFYPSFFWGLRFDRFYCKLYNINYAIREKGEAQRKGMGIPKERKLRI